MSSTVAPMSFKYAQLPTSIPARKRTRRFQPTNGDVFSPASTSVIRIPIRDQNYLDGSNSYLKFKLTNNTGFQLNLDPNANAVITRVRILVGGVVAEDIERANILTNMLTQSQGSEDFLKSLQIVSGGAITDQDASNLLAGEDMANGASETYCIPVFSGLLNCGKFLPLGLFQSNALTLELYLEQTNHIGVISGDPTGDYKLSSVEYIASLIEIQDDATNKQLEMQMNTSGLEFHGTTYSTHINSLSATATNGSINIPERCKSLKGLITVLRPSDNTRASTSLQTRYPHTTAGTDFNWYYRIGSENLPQVAVGSSAESFLEFQKTYNHLWSLNQSTYANKARWNTAWDVDTNAGCFSMTVSTESFSHTNMMESGLDTASSAIPISLQLNGVSLSGHSAEVITYSYKDIIWRFDSSGMFQVSL